MSESIRNRRATQPPAHFQRNPPGRGQLAVFPCCSLLTYRFRYDRRSRLEKQPTDLRRKACLFRGQDTILWCGLGFPVPGRGWWSRRSQIMERPAMKFRYSLRGHAGQVFHLFACLRNRFPVEAVEQRAYFENAQFNNQVPRIVVPPLLPTSRPVHEFARVDLFVPGCPPSADTIYFVLTELLAGRMPDLSDKTRFGA